MHTRVAILWHMHQPTYLTVGGEMLLPWVRLHATHSYLDMGRLLLRHPKVRVTVNFTASLLEQLALVAARAVKEPWLDVTARAAESLTADERRFVVEQFFHVQHERNIVPVPRYRELLALKGRGPDAFSAADLRDLQVHFTLAWMGFTASEVEPDIARLRAKGTGYDEDDKRVLLAAQQRLVESIVPLWSRLAASGQVELSTTPWQHPILPLVLDSDVALRAQPHARLPPRFSWSEDAAQHVDRAMETFTRLFGQPPAGMWPAEGSVSPEAAALFASRGLHWIATDEGILGRSLGADPGVGLFHPWQYETTSGPISILFRDRTLSDRIGFVYAKSPPADAAGDVLKHLRGVGIRAAAPDARSPTVAVILDGENAWEHYPEHGGPFLDALYTALEADPTIETVTASEATAVPGRRLAQLATGSWIDSNFRIWIGHAEDNAGWTALGKVRAAWDRHAAAADVSPERLEAARTHLLVAEGSDWFWWYGDDFETANAAEFDLLFRSRLLEACRLLGETPPRSLLEPISAKARKVPTPPRALVPAQYRLTPRIDGHSRSYTEWLGAGIYRPGLALGAMHRAQPRIDEVAFGNDDARFYARIHLRSPLGAHDRIKVTVTTATGAGASEATVDAKGLAGAAPTGSEAAVGDVVEVALPLPARAGGDGRKVKLGIEWHDAEGLVDRVPAQGELELELVDVEWERRRWEV